ncbi:30S ribosomal protein S16 [Candidatus Beckwithbacteria bacterium CG10_big_fil_rev_8_21_14_0_10_34_10]|uniref:Small ribosomal subunit protein bS16 n=1 Tax=Candidatus Beckwithbacteria bacterium CG10_big_fil_rev_8_21_14_0_10_34_10 TaxID=1974495 RepID=A0A2H0WAH7_9BACT|nr:MAG: 30S ribosomal protein S16 [Candidatus Beckwithbacteria bacterium CG10_big_fil_rev_8_21_14_0_10_34_10]
MLKVKLRRQGKRHQPYYRIIIAEAKSKRDGKYIESLGTYYPLGEKKVFALNQKKYQSWIKKGAQPTETVKKLVERYSIKKDPII